MEYCHPDHGSVEDIRLRIRSSSDPYEGRVRQITFDQAMELQKELDLYPASR